MDSELRVEYMRLSDVEAAFERGNPRRHDVAGIADSIRERGFNAPPLLNEKTGRLVFGHGRTKALRSLCDTDPDATPVRIDRAEDGEWTLPVFRGVAFRSKAEAEEYLIADNRLTEKGGWEPESTAKILERIRARDRLVGTGYRAGEVEKLLAKVRKNAPERDAPIPDVPDAAGVERGDIWQLGRHRLMCGDSLNGVDLARLLSGVTVDMALTDPPFAIYGSSTGIGADIADTKMIAPFFRAACEAMARAVVEHGHVYIHCDWRSYPALCEAALAAALAPKNLLVWDKGDGGLGSMYRQCHELVGLWSRVPPATAMRSTTRTGARKIDDGNILRYTRPTGGDRLHNAAKPVPMEQRLVRNSSDPGDRVLDLFNGSGSVLIACEREKRVCLAMDLEPREVRKTIRRWELETGQTATRIDTAPLA